MIAPPLVEYVNRAGRVFARMALVRDDFGYGHAPLRFFDQPRLEQTLRAGLDRFPHVQLALGTELVGLHAGRRRRDRAPVRRGHRPAACGPREVRARLRRRPQRHPRRRPDPAGRGELRRAVAGGLRRRAARRGAGRGHPVRLRLAAPGVRVSRCGRQLPAGVHAAPGRDRGRDAAAGDHRRARLAVRRPGPVRRHPGGGLQLPPPHRRTVARRAGVPAGRRGPPDAPVHGPGPVQRPARRGEPVVEAGPGAVRRAPTPRCSTRTRPSGARTPWRWRGRASGSGASSWPATGAAAWLRDTVLRAVQSDSPGTAVRGAVRVQAGTGVPAGSDGRRPTRRRGRDDVPPATGSSLRDRPIARLLDEALGDGFAVLGPARAGSPLGPRWRGLPVRFVAVHPAGTDWQVRRSCPATGRRSGWTSSTPTVCSTGGSGATTPSWWCCGRTTSSSPLRRRPVKPTGSHGDCLPPSVCRRAKWAGPFRSRNVLCPGGRLPAATDGDPPRLIRRGVTRSPAPSGRDGRDPRRAGRLPVLARVPPVPPAGHGSAGGLEPSAGHDLRVPPHHRCLCDEGRKGAVANRPGQARAAVRRRRHRSRRR